MSTWGKIVFSLVAVILVGFAVAGAYYAGGRLAKWRTTAPAGWRGVRDLTRRRPCWWRAKRRLRAELDVMVRHPFIATIEPDRIRFTDGSYLHRARFVADLTHMSRGQISGRHVLPVRAWHLHQPDSHIAQRDGIPALWTTASDAVTTVLFSVLVLEESQ